jgi:hypothetical protein
MIVGVVAALATALAAPAFAQEPPPDPGSSAVDQYVELVPTGRGPKSPGVEKERKTPLAPKAKRALDKTPKATADALTTVATSSDYGAPVVSEAPSTRSDAPATSPRAKPRFTPGPGGSSEASIDAPSPAKQPSLNRTLQATAAAAAPVDDTRMIVLLVVFLATAIAGGALAARRRRL